jgi:hypothetical protein
MTRLARRASLLVALSLLTSAATAHAECAWVLWSEALETGSRPGFSILRAHATLQDCEASARTAYLDLGSPNVRSGVFVWTPNRQMQVRFTCLPDTVNPREAWK